ncbi:MICAL-like protein 1 isoform X2 [Scyliorhinus torazame]|uniref:MICAL-like protein 1 isoform X2 n=1 Tax=Scyliorhinus torazame TaxID=75743 RepID=UPI003B5C4722
MATRALQEWARIQAAGYPGVEVKNMSSSFRDGLAFCAIIHRHRPDLIDFDLLSKENVYENNRLAFEVAEQELGVPALLDPEDMVAMRVPDRLSILTYVSQLYNYFTNQTHAGVPPSMKRPAETSPSEPLIKKAVTVSKQVLSSNNDSSDETAERPSRNTLSSKCAICSKHVHLVQRYLVDGKLYHRNCFRCKECSSTLLPGAYKPGAHLGTFVCTHHRGRVTGQLQRPLSGQPLQSHHGSGSLPAQTLSSASPLTRHRPQGPTERSEDYKRSPSLETEINEEEDSEKSNTKEGLSLSVKQLSAVFSIPAGSSHFITGTTSRQLVLSHSSDLEDTSKPGADSHPGEEALRSTDSCDPKEQSERGVGEQPLPGPQSDLQNSQTEPQQAAQMEMGIATENTASTNASGTPVRCTDKSPDTNLASVNKETPDEKLKTPPVPVPRKTVDSASSPVTTPRPVPRTRISFGGGSVTGEIPVQKPESTILVNGGVTEQPTPVPKPRDRPQSLTERKGEDSKAKEHPWIALVNSESKRRLAPPRPGVPAKPSSAQEEAAESHALNPFDMDDEEEADDTSENVQSAASTDTTPKSNHPWYGIQLTNSPRSKKRPAPRVPNASPSASHSLQFQTHDYSASETSPSPSLSMESISGNSAKSTPELHRRFEAGTAENSPAAACENPAAASESHTAASESHTAASESHTAASESHTAASESHTAASESHTAASESHTAASESHTAASESHTAASESHTAASESHTAASESHTAASESHTAASENPAAATENPAAATESHTAASENHAAATESHTAATESHTAASENPADATESLTAVSESHTATSENPADATESHTAATESHTAATESHTAATESHTAATERHTAATESHTAATESHTAATESHTAATESLTEVTESPAAACESNTAANENSAASANTLLITESPSPSSHHRPPPKPPVSRSPQIPARPSPETNRLKHSSTDHQPKSSCKENPFDRKSSPAGITAPPRPRKGPKPARPPAPGHGFPLIKRKVHADQYIPEESIQGELEQLEQSLDELEHHGVALEEKLRSCENDEEEDDLLVDWFKLIHEKHMLVRRESELVYTFKQQNLEERQADVEYELRCLLNKPEKDWTDEDRARETELMQELITVIEQRNAIINSLDEDRQREEEEDKVLAAMIKNKDFHKDTNSEIKKKLKFKPSKMLKFLGNKPEGKSKNTKEKNL